MKQKKTKKIFLLNKTKMENKKTLSTETMIMIAFLMVVGIVNFSLAVAGFAYWEKKDLKKLMSVYIATLVLSILFIIGAVAIAFKMDEHLFILVALAGFMIVGSTGYGINRLQLIKDKSLADPEVIFMLSNMKLNHYGGMSIALILGIICALYGIAMIVGHVQKNKSQEIV